MRLALGFCTVGAPNLVPTDVSGLTGWFADSFTLSGANITQWNDLSGLGNHLPGVATQGGYPTKTAAFLNGHDVATFTPAGLPPGNPNHGGSQSFLGTSLATYISEAEHTIYALVYLIDLSSLAQVASTALWSTRDSWLADDKGRGIQMGCNGQTATISSFETQKLSQGAPNDGGTINLGTETVSLTVGTPSLGSWFLATHRMKAGNTGFRVGTASSFTEIATTGPFLSTYTPKIRVGAAVGTLGGAQVVGMHGYIAQLITFNRALTDQEDAGIVNYLRQYCGLTFGVSVSAVSPAYAIDTGGTALTITGTGFVSGATVTVGGASATSVVVTSPTTITCVAPTGTGGNAVDVVVTDPDGEASTATAAVTYYSIPTAIGASNTAWWADTITTDAGGVLQWTDLTANARHFAKVATPQPANLTVTNCTSGTAGVINVTTSQINAFSTNDQVTISGVTGTTEANGTFTITWVDAHNFSLNGTTFVHAYVNGGTATNLQTRQPSKVSAGLNGHDIIDLTPTAPASGPNGPQFLSSGASWHMSQLISAATYYWYWLVKVTRIDTNVTSGSQYSNVSLYADNGNSFFNSIILESGGPTIGTYNYGGNVDPTNGEYAKTTFTLGAWMIVTGRHLAGKAGIRIGSGAWVETTSGDTQFAFGNSATLMGVSFSTQNGVAGQVAASAVFNAAPTTQQDLALLAYFRQYGGL
jgi:hypothetical protein